jgi:hypothetical protein
MSIDWCGSATLDLDVSDGDRAYLTCRSGVRRAGFRLFRLKGMLLLALYLTLRRNRYIDFELQRIEHAG